MDASLPTVQYLFREVKVDPTIRSIDGVSAVEIAAARGDLEVCSIQTFNLMMARC